MLGLILSKGFTTAMPRQIHLPNHSAQLPPVLAGQTPSLRPLLLLQEERLAERTGPAGMLQQESAETAHPAPTCREAFRLAPCTPSAHGAAAPQAERTEACSSPVFDLQGSQSLNKSPLMLHELAVPMSTKHNTHLHLMSSR